MTDRRRFGYVLVNADYRLGNIKMPQQIGYSFRGRQKHAEVRKKLTTINSQERIKVEFEVGHLNSVGHINLK